LFVSPLQDVSTAGLRAIGLPIVECVDYMETHPLGRAEWMKFLGLLFECEQRAD
jgi:iron complex transport system substrate-binding protein